MTKAARAGIALAWVAAVVAAVWVGDALISMGKEGEESLSQKREQWTRLQGWLEAEEQVASLRSEALGRFAAAEPKDTGWLFLQGLQETALAEGLAITDLRPSQVKAQGKKGKTLFRLDAKLEGNLAQIDRLLQSLPRSLPGVRLENLQLVPQEGGKVQGVMRMEWTL